MLGAVKTRIQPKGTSPGQTATCVLLRGHEAEPVPHHRGQAVPEDRGRAAQADKAACSSLPEPGCSCPVSSNFYQCHNSQMNLSGIICLDYVELQGAVTLCRSVGAARQPFCR